MYFVASLGPARFTLRPQIQALGTQMVNMIQDYRYSIQLFFEMADELIIARLIQDFRELGLVNVEYIKPTYRPHISLSVHRSLPQAWAINIVKVLASRYKKQYVQFPYAGVFPGTPTALYIGVLQSGQLVTMHEDLHMEISEGNIDCWELYLPGQWIPHCGLLIDDNEKQIAIGVEHLLQNHPPGGTLSSIGVCGFDQKFEIELREGSESYA